MKLSHSEVETFGQCETKHKYGYIRNLAPVGGNSLALDKGSCGHLMMEFWGQGVMAGFNYKQALMNAFMKMSESDFSTELIGEVFNLVKNAIDYIESLKWKRIIAVEQQLEIPLNADIEYGFIADAIIEDKNGKIIVVDYKFLGDFYSDEVTDVLPQIPKYIGALQRLGYSIDDGAYLMVRTRKLREDNPDKVLYRQLNVNPNRVLQSLKEQLEVSKRIIERKNNPNIPASHTANKMNCEYCPFRMLCAKDLNGEKVDLFLRLNFKERKSGFDAAKAK